MLTVVSSHGLPLRLGYFVFSNIKRLRYPHSVLRSFERNAVGRPPVADRFGFLNEFGLLGVTRSHTKLAGWDEDHGKFNATR